MGVNDLVTEWLSGHSFEDADASGDPHLESEANCASDLDHIARTAWHPVSEPPTEADGDDHGLVLMFLREDGKEWVVPLHYKEVRGEAGGEVEPDALWARIRNVVLMPPQGGE